MARAGSKSKSTAPRRLPRGRHALPPEQVLADQRQRLLAAVPSVVAERGFEAMSVADVVKRAAVSRNAFYRNFKDKQECFAIAQEAGYERLFEILTRPGEDGATVAERVEGSLAAALDALASDPAMARLLFVESPASAGEQNALRHHDWLLRYGTLLAVADPGAALDSPAAAEFGQVIAGGIASRIASEILAGRTERLRDLTPHLTEYVLTFYGQARRDPRAAEPVEEQRRQSGA